MGPDASLAYMDSLRNGVPSITFRMVCYHYEEYQNSKGHTFKDKVVSKEVTQKFPLRGYTDETISGMAAQKALSAAQISLALGHFPLVFHPRCRLTEQAIDSARQMFFDRERSDKYQDEFEDYTIDGVDVKEHALLAMDARPHWMISCGFFLSAIVGFSACYRRALYASVCKVEFPVTKHVSIFTPHQWDAEPMHILSTGESDLGPTLRAATNAPSNYDESYATDPSFESVQVCGNQVQFNNAEAQV